MRRAQVVVVGGGPAGLSAAAAASREGAQVILCEENASLGGQLRYRIGSPVDSAPSAPSTCQLFETLVEEVKAAGVEVRTGAVVWGLFAGGILAVSESHDGYQIAAEQIVLATGSTDLPFPFAGGTLPGVMTARACQILLHVHRVLPGRNVAVIGAGIQADEVARDVVAGGARLVVQIDPDRDGRQIEAGGDAGVQRVTVAGRGYDVDLIVGAVGRQPDVALALLAACEVGYEERLGGFVPLRDADLRCSVPGIIVAGDAGGVCDVTTAMAEGRFAGMSAAASLCYVDPVRRSAALVAYAHAVGDRVAMVGSLAAAPART